MTQQQITTIQNNLRTAIMELRMGQQISMPYHNSTQQMSPQDVELKLNQVSRALSAALMSLNELVAVVGHTRPV